jgi:hypothetical protein
MARSQRDSRLDTRTARLKLAPNKNPYLMVIEPGRALAYRRLDGRPGTWTARLGARDSGRVKYSWQPLGTADDYSDADGIDVRTFAQAQAAARQWFDGAKVASGKVVAPGESHKAISSRQHRIPWILVRSPNGRRTENGIDLVGPGEHPRPAYRQRSAP